MTADNRPSWVARPRRGTPQPVRTLALAIAICLATLLALPAASEAGQSTHHPRTLSAADRARIIQSLGDRAPESFDIVLDDPCPGLWGFEDYHGRVAIGIQRYRGVLLAHFLLLDDDFSEANAEVFRIGTHTIRFDWDGKQYTMQCIGDDVHLESRRPTDPPGTARHLSIGAIDGPPPEQ